MFLYWGTRRNDKTLGYVADFCPICRDVKAFTLRQVRMAGHIYGIALGGKTLGFSETCRTCQIAQLTDASRFGNPLRKLPPNLSTLVGETHPGLREEMGARLALEQQIQRAPGSLSPEERRRLIKEPFVVIEQNEMLTLKETSAKPALALLAAFIAPFVVAMVLSGVPQITTIAAILTFVGFIAYAIWLACAEFVQKMFQSSRLLARALSPLQPTDSEIAAALNDLDVSGRKPWVGCRPEKVQRWIAGYRKRNDRADANASGSASIRI